MFMVYMTVGFEGKKSEIAVTILPSQKPCWRNTVEPKQWGNLSLGSFGKRDVYASFAQTLSGPLLQCAFLVSSFCEQVSQRGRMFHQWVSEMSADSRAMVNLSSFRSQALVGHFLYWAQALLCGHSKLDLPSLLQAGTLSVTCRQPMQPYQPTPHPEGGTPSPSHPHLYLVGLPVVSEVTSGDLMLCLGFKVPDFFNLQTHLTWSLGAW